MKNKHNSNKACFITHFLLEMDGLMLGDTFYTRMILRRAQQPRLRMAEMPSESKPISGDSDVTTWQQTAWR